MEVGNVVISWVGNARLLCIALNLQIDFQYPSVLSKPDTPPPPPHPTPNHLSVNFEFSVVLLVHLCVRMKTVILQLGWWKEVLHPRTAWMNLAYCAMYM
jgi:hypothetical protein